MLLIPIHWCIGSTATNCVENLVLIMRGWRRRILFKTNLVRGRTKRMMNRILIKSWIRRRWIVLPLSTAGCMAWYGTRLSVSSRTWCARLSLALRSFIFFRPSGLHGINIGRLSSIDWKESLTLRPIFYNFYSLKPLLLLPSQHRFCSTSEAYFS